VLHAEIQKPSEMKDITVILIKLFFLCKFKILRVSSYILVNIVYNELCMRNYGLKLGTFNFMYQLIKLHVWVCGGGGGLEKMMGEL
jgi:hypothetical protein